jgi:hypothetical protein
LPVVILRSVMNKKIALVLMSLVTVGVAGMAVMSSYGSVTGYATVSQAVKIDLMGSSNDQNYTMDVKQGEIAYSPQIKIDNSANASFYANITSQIAPGSAGNESDVKISLVNEFKNETLSNPVSVTASDFRFYLKHEFEPNANLGNYSFGIEIEPA